MTARLRAFYRRSRKAVHVQVPILGAWALASVPGGVTWLEWLALGVALTGGPVVFHARNEEP